MKAIVFGGSGFLGSHVADALSEHGYDVTVFDIKESPYLQVSQTMLVGDVLDENQVYQAIKGQDYVYNFAGIADLDDATTKPKDTVELNVLGNLNIMEAAARAKAQRYLYASSVYVYSQKGGFYRCSKQASELYIEEYQRKYDLNFTILRYGTLYGPRADDRNSIYRYLKQALDQNKIICSGCGDELREYIQVKDAASLSVEALKEKYKNEHIIITGHHPLKFKEMLFMIREIINQDIKIEFTGEENLDHYNYTPYSFAPKIGKKLVDNYYTDMGQALLECLHEMYNLRCGLR